MIKRIALLASVAPLALNAFETKAGWKLDADGKIEMKDGNPVWINSAGQEQVLQADTISRLNAEAKGFRERAEKAENALKPFDGLDPETARKAVETVGKLDAKKLIDAGEVDKVREEVAKGYTAQIAEKDKAIADLTGNLDNLYIDKVFDNDFVRNDIAMPRDFFESAMRSHFKRENGEIKAYDRSGNPIYSKERMGELAKPEEALRILVESHPQKDTIMRAPSAGGSGNGGGGGQRGGSRVIKRADFDALNPVQQQEMAAAAGKGELTIAD